MLQRLLIIDSNALIHRSFHALPKLTNPDGKEIQGVYGFCLVFLKILKLFKPDYIVAAFDLPHPTFRHQQFKDYKATRVRAPQELYDQIPLVKEFLGYINVPVVEQAGYEADDLIGSIVEHYKKKENFEIIILTGDLDTLQLVDSNVKVCTFKKGISDNIMYDEESIKTRFGGLKPKELVEFKGLKGDVSDNIPGVKGIGDKTAVQLVKQFGSLENLFEAVDKGLDYWQSLGFKKRTYIILQNQKKTALFSRELARIKTDLDVKLDFEAFSTQKANLDKLKSFFYKHSFKSLIVRLNELSFNSKSDPAVVIPNYIAKTNQPESRMVFKPASLFKQIKQTKKFFVEIKQSGLTFIDIKSHAIFIKNSDLNRQKRFLGLLTSSDYFKLIDNYGALYHFILENYGQNIVEPVFDFTIAGYLLDPGRKHYPIEALIYKYMEGSGSIFELCHKLEEKLNNLNLTSLYREIELPLVKVLAYMTHWGCRVNTSYLETLQASASQKLKLIADEIYKMTKLSINLNSPRQVAWLLFEKMGLPQDKVKKTKEGQVSTSTKYLSKLRGSFEIVDLILEYREIEKLLGTYINPILNYVNKKDSRIHPMFNQTATSTGRLSCESPNLQALPQKSEIQNQIRRAFEASPGYKLVSFDYSQIELRIIASLSGEPKLIQFFKENKDVHILTASLIFNKKESEVTPKERQIAKTINFGIIYGLSSFGLSETLSIPYSEAQNFINAYFDEYPKIKEFIQLTINQTKKLGYNKTLLGRIRFIPEIQSNNDTLAKQGERMAVNFPIQGSQADIIKKAMVEIFTRLSVYKEDARMIMQIHDELVFEVKEERLDELVSDVKRIMERAVLLRVPVRVDVASGSNLAELTAYEPKTLL